MKNMKSKIKQKPFVDLVLHGMVFLTILLLIVFFWSCHETPEESDVPMNSGTITQKSGLSYSGCKASGLKSTYEAPEICASLETVDSDYLLIQHFDAVFNCSFDSLIIDYNVDGDVINVNESHVNPGVYCTCKYDISYKIGPLDYGTYKIHLLDEALNKEELCLEVEFSADTDTTYYQ
ncbi:hypothetical protein [Marinilabilia sp.]|uniref:hypothetical protein n=1 Tax=Marinilabilia sp. TaxID=2021252 RepID=UPI0025C0DD97|nr:hypothetical protein [Marinilabilia sp.]